MSGCRGPIAIHGAGGHGRVATEIARLLGFDPIGFLDDSADAERPAVDSANGPVRIARDLSAFPPRTPVHVAIGDNATRERVHRSHADPHPRRGETLVHPAASVSASAAIADNVLVGPLAVVGVGAVVAEGAIVNSGAIVEHGCNLQPFCHVAPGAVLGGGVRVGARALVGLGSRVLPGRSIGADAVVGAGSVVLCDVADGETVVGVVQ